MMPRYVNPCRLVKAQSRLDAKRLKAILDSHDRDFVERRISQMRNPLEREEARKYFRACYVV